MRVRSLSDLASALASKATEEAKTRPVQLPVPYTAPVVVKSDLQRRRTRIPTAAETAENRISLLISEGTRYYETSTFRKEKEGDPCKVYLGPRFVQPRHKVVLGRGY